MTESKDLLNDDISALAQTLFEIGAVRFGDFTLHSGIKSPIYIDLRLLASFPQALRQAADAYAAILEKKAFDLLGATPLAGLPIGTAISLRMNKPLIYARPSTKGYGTGKQIEGRWEVGQRVVMVDDLITSGDSLLQGIGQLREAGLVVTEAVVLLDRQQGGREALREQGVALTSAMTLEQALEILIQQGKITESQREEVLQVVGVGKIVPSKG